MKTLFMQEAEPQQMRGASAAIYKDLLQKLAKSFARIGKTSQEGQVKTPRKPPVSDLASRSSTAI
jgi:hypothetical protein